MRRATRHIHLDKNHKAICDELRNLGVEVVEIMEPVDIFAFYKNFGGFIEIKPEGRGTYRRKQLKFLSETRVPCAIARTASEAMKFLESGKGLSAMQKDKLAGFLVLNKGDKWNAEMIERVLSL